MQKAWSEASVKRQRGVGVGVGIGVRVRVSGVTSVRQSDRHESFDHRVGAGVGVGVSGVGVGVGVGVSGVGLERTPSQEEME